MSDENQENLSSFLINRDHPVHEGLPVPAEAPWILQLYFDSDDSKRIKLAEELSHRFQNMPMLSVAKFRTLPKRATTGVAILTTQDGSAQLTIDVDKDTQLLQMAFTWSAMLTLTFELQGLSNLDRSHWLAGVRRDHGDPAFLWGPARWEYDYLITIKQRYFTNLHVFSPQSKTAASVNLTPEITNQLLTWLEKIWQLEDGENNPTTLLTW